MNRARIRVHREASYYATDAEAAAVSDNAGAVWPATIVRVNADRTVNLHVLRGDGTSLAKTDVEQSERQGGYSLRVAGGAR